MKQAGESAHLMDKSSQIQVCEQRMQTWPCGHESSRMVFAEIVEGIFILEKVILSAAPTQR